MIGVNGRGPAAQKRLLLIELNEFDPALLEKTALALGLRNIPRALALAHSTTDTEDEREHHGLDPWVQWVSVHTGTPTSEHGIKRLGMTKNQAAPQVWEVVAKSGRTWGAWGVMNAPRGSGAGCRFFMPDPWSFDEVAYPAALNDVLALPRYVSKNYLDVSPRLALANACRMIAFLARPANWLIAYRFAVVFIRTIAQGHRNVHTMTTLLDYLSALIFVQLRRRSDPDFSIIFLNHIAHLQHQFWSAGRLDPEMELGIRICDAIIGLLLDDLRPGEAVIVMNALKQVNVEGHGSCGYRQRNPEQALRLLGIVDARVEQCMTNDANLFLGSDAAADRAERILSDVSLNGEKLFFVERIAPRQVFYRLVFDRRVEVTDFIVGGIEKIRFCDIFEYVAERTGAHVPFGDVYAAGIELPERLENHAVFGSIVRHFASVTS